MYSISSFMGKLFSGRTTSGVEQSQINAASAPDSSAPSAASSSKTAQQPTVAEADSVIAATSVIAADPVISAVPGPTGLALAKQVMAQSKASSTWKESKDILTQGFKDLQSSSITEPSQRDMATFGLAALSMVKNDTIAAFLGCHVMRSVASGSAQVDVAGIASSLTKKADEVSSWKDALDYYRTGFKAIESYPGTTAEARENAKFGSWICADSGTDVDIAMICKNVADAISHSQPVVNLPGLAKKLQQRAQDVSSWKEARESLRFGFKAMENYPCASPQQKQLAAYGTQIVKSISDDNNACSLADQVLLSLNSSRLQVASADIAQLSITRARDTSSWSSAVQIYKDGFKAIADNPDASPEEKEFSTWGAAALNQKGDSAVLGETAGCLMETLKSGKADLDLKALAAFTGKAADSASSWTTAKGYVSTAFKVIELSPFATADIKILAKKGYRDCMAGPNTDDAVKTSLKALNDLANTELRRKEAQEEIKKMAENLNDSNDKKAVAVEEDYIDVDGIKLKRRVVTDAEKV